MCVQPFPFVVECQKKKNGGWALTYYFAYDCDCILFSEHNS